ncbi:hypothetical protein Prudu_808S000100 [Prunus dulcis]|uniref:Uncharacterized protein n=1 Tax=Prunus dulcis TaxID=3755 RepID=A0A5H2Y4B0_PRUDU|nr:hypothetical protein Prudu_808S000100 [Prunus dulcis]
MSDLIRRGRSMTTAPSSDPPAQLASAATAPALMKHMLVGPGASQAAAPARQHHRDDIDRGTGASGSQPVSSAEDGEGHPVTNSRISIGYDERHRAAPRELHSSLATTLARSCGPIARCNGSLESGGSRQLSTNYNLEDLDEESLT